MPGTGGDGDGVARAHLTDLVADTRAPTPSAAAELAVGDAVELEQRVRKSARELAARAELVIERCQSRLNRLELHRFQKHLQYQLPLA